MSDEREKALLHLMISVTEFFNIINEVLVEEIAKRNGAADDE